MLYVISGIHALNAYLHAAPSATLFPLVHACATQNSRYRVRRPQYEFALEAVSRAFFVDHRLREYCPGEYVQIYRPAGLGTLTRNTGPEP